MQKSLDLLGSMDRYKVERLLQKSFVLQPLEQFDAYRIIVGQHRDTLSKSLLDAQETRDRKQLEEKLSALFKQKHTGTEGVHSRAKILTMACQLGHRLGEPYARGLLERWPAIIAELGDSHAKSQSQLLEQAMFLAAHYDLGNQLDALVLRFQTLVIDQASTDLELVNTLEQAMKNCFRGLRKMGMRDRIHDLLTAFSNVFQLGEPEKKAAEKVATPSKSGKPNSTKLMTSAHTDRIQAQLLRLMLPVASGWFAFNQVEKTIAILDQARALLASRKLLVGDNPLAQDHVNLSLAYIRALGDTSAEFAMPKLFDVFQKIPWAGEKFSLYSHYSLYRFQVVEAIVLALVSDSFSLDESSRRWLDDDEYLVRRRIHNDVRLAMSQI